MKKDPNNADKFRCWITLQRLKHREVAEYLGISLQTIRNLLIRGFIPGLKLAVKIELLTKGEVRARNWIDSENVEFDVQYIQEIPPKSENHKVNKDGHG